MNIFDAITRFFARLFELKEGGTVMPSPKRPKFMDIDITVSKLSAPTKEWPDGYKFEMSDEKGKGLGKKVDFKNDKHPGFIVLFTLVEGDKHNPTGCQFLPDLDDAMWVQPSGLPDPPCPSSPAYWGQFRAVDVVDHSKTERFRTLIVYNKNGFEQMFAFTLRFEIPGYSKVVEFDPVGNNQNGDR